MWDLVNDFLALCIWRISCCAVSFWSVKFLRKQAAMLIAACSQMNAPSEQLQSIKGPQSAWSIWRDKDQSLRMLEFYLAAATVYFCPGDSSSSHHEHIYSCLSRTFSYRGLTSNLCWALIDMSVEWYKRLHFRQITLFIVFFSFIWPHAF